MTIEIPLPALVDVHPGVWIALGVVAYYAAVGMCIRLFLPNKLAFAPGSDDARDLIWLFSPIIVPVLLFVTLLSLIGYVLSFGIVRPIWEWK